MAPADTIGAGTGAINFSLGAFGYSLVVNTSQSKPIIGSASVPQLDVTFTATGTGTVFLYAGDTDFLGAHSFNLSLRRHQLGRQRHGDGSRVGRQHQQPADLLAAARDDGAAVWPRVLDVGVGIDVPREQVIGLSIGGGDVGVACGTTTATSNFSVPWPASMNWSRSACGTDFSPTLRRRPSKQSDVTLCGPWRDARALFCVRDAAYAYFTYRRGAWDSTRDDVQSLAAGYAAQPLAARRSARPGAVTPPPVRSRNPLAPARPLRVSARACYCLGWRPSRPPHRQSAETTRIEPCR